MKRACAVTLKIPDNAAYTALTTLQRLGVDLSRVERSDIFFVDDDGDAATFAARMQRDETIFNPNKHRLTALETVAPRAGELWVLTLGERDDFCERCAGWRLFGTDDAPASHDLLQTAAERLFVNPAIEKAVY